MITRAFSRTFLVAVRAWVRLRVDDRDRQHRPFLCRCAASSAGGVQQRSGLDVCSGRLYRADCNYVKDLLC